MEIRKLRETDLNACFAIRLRALENSPSAFLTTLAEVKARGPESIAKALESICDDNVIFGAVFKGNVVGMIGLRREERPKIKHKAMIWGMYVDVDQRNAGIGDKLLKMAIQHARENMKVSAIYLSVESENRSAKHLYQSQGFKTWGVEPLAMADRGRFFNEDHMVLLL